MPRPHPEGDAAVLVSGGVDSAVLCVEMLGEFQSVHPIYVRFGLRWESVEENWLRRFLDSVSKARPGLRPLTVLDEPIAQVYGEHWSNAGRSGVPGAETDDDAVYLPGRNILLAAKAAVWCRLRDVETLAFGILKGNPFPDSTPEFFHGLEATLNVAMSGRLRIVRPYAGLSKAEVLKCGAELPLHLTFSCLNPVDERHCGACNKCAERSAAFSRTGRADRTEYADDHIE
jgi:7-cyano-7-deazaguanine synthase